IDVDVHGPGPPVYAQCKGAHVDVTIGEVDGEVVPGNQKFRLAPTFYGLPGPLKGLGVGDGRGWPGAGGRFIPEVFQPLLVFASGLGGTCPRGSWHGRLSERKVGSTPSGSDRTARGKKSAVQVDSSGRQALCKHNS